MNDPTSTPPRRGPWREWRTVILIDLVVCTVVHAALSWTFDTPDLDRVREVHGTGGIVRVEIVRALGGGLFFALFKLSLCPQHWVLRRSSWSPP